MRVSSRENISFFTNKLRRIVHDAPVWILFLLGLWLVVLHPLGPHLSLLPGDLQDSRFNNYILEHFYRWVTGQTHNYINAPFFFPFKQALAFSDTLLGSAPFYTLFRFVGFDSETAFQFWFILGFFLNYIAASYVLKHLHLKPLAIGAGAFFFTYGLPLLAQENHVQLLYRFCIPLACLSFWDFCQKPKLWALFRICIWVVWQFYLTIYMGAFLLLLLAVLVILAPFFFPGKTILRRLTIIPRCLGEAWSHAYITERLLTTVSILVLGSAYGFLLLQYYRVTRMYYFSRDLSEIFTMLPKWQSFLLADNSQLWNSTTNQFYNISMRHEHQLFPGLAVLTLILLGILLHFHTENRKIAWFHFSAAIILLVFTFDFNGFSFYTWIGSIPGINSIRAITRIILVIMWPLSLFIAWVIDGLLQNKSQNLRWLKIPVYMIIGLLITESVLYTHLTFNKKVAQDRIELLYQQIPSITPENPILYVFNNPTEPDWMTDIDAMLLAQKLGWSTVNGYSGNYPPGYSPANSCTHLPASIKNYMVFSGVSDSSYYLSIINRVVPLGFTDCDPLWWKKMP
jgi:hypothetical protein